MTRQGGWTCCPVAKDTQNQAKLKRKLPGLNPLRSDGSHGSYAGGRTGCPVAKDTQMRVGKQLWTAKIPS